MSQPACQPLGHRAPRHISGHDSWRLGARLRRTIVTVIALIGVLQSAGALATNHLVRINELMAGALGDPEVQFVEMVANGSSQKDWGPNGGPVGRAILRGFDAAGNPTGTFSFPSNPPPGNDTVLIATQAFVDATSIAADFIIPPLLSTGAGQLCFEDNPASTGAVAIQLCVSYGGAAFTGPTKGGGPPHPATLSFGGFQSLGRVAGFHAQSSDNRDFALGPPTPANTTTAGLESDLEHNVSGDFVDRDGDSVADVHDAFALDPTEQADTDLDGIGNNADPDDDGDQQPDLVDNCPLHPNPDQGDLDGDRVGDACDDDRDGDGVSNPEDAFPDDPNETVDTDLDGIGNEADLDDDGDGTPDATDHFPLDRFESTDSDGDGSGDNADTDDDNDGTPDATDAFPLDPGETTDTDGDGTGDQADPDDDGDQTPDGQDNCPLVANPDQSDLDGDGHGDLCDGDIDGDGVGNASDAFAYDPTEVADTDGDGTGDVADLDDDGDAVPDPSDNCPLSPNPDQSDRDDDGAGDACDPVADVDVRLSANGFDFALDPARGQLYVSVPLRAEIQIISLADNQVVASVALPGEPHGIELSTHGPHLYAALHTAAAVSAIDLDTLAVTTYPLSPALKTDAAHDVVEVDAGRLVIAGDGSPARVLLLDTATEVLTPLADGRSLFNDPFLVRDRASATVYLAEASIPPSLYALDLATDGGPIIRQDAHGSLDGTGPVALASSGAMLALESGQILRAATFGQKTRVPAGVSAFNQDASRLYIAEGGARIAVFETAAFRRVDTITLACQATSFQRIAVLEDKALALLGADRVCVEAIPAEPSLADLGNALGGAPFDLRVDPRRARLYVSVPTRSEVLVLDSATLEVHRRIPIAGAPHGLDIGPDARYLYTALNQGGAAARIDLDTFEVTEFDLTAALNSSAAYDVAVPSPGRVIVTANPGTSRFARVGQVQTETGELRTVASARVVRGAPVIESGRGARFAYIGEGFSVNSLYRLDLGRSDAPMDLEDVHGTVDGTQRFALSPDALHIVLGSGQVLSTFDFSQVAVVPPGSPRYTDDGQRLFVMTSPGTLAVVDPVSFRTVGTTATPCTPAGALQAYRSARDASALFVLEADRVCRFALSLEALLDTDDDGVNDALDLDDDGDGVPDDVDNCPLLANPDQHDLDRDQDGDVCDPDRDGDTVVNGVDNCPDVPNPGQTDSDDNGTGDVCETDRLEVRINEVLAGLNGDSAVQYVELLAKTPAAKRWGPDPNAGPRPTGRAMLAFFDQRGEAAGRFVFPADAPPGAATVLVATPAFSTLTGATPDFVMPRQIMPIAGRVCLRGNPDAPAPAHADTCVSYGGAEYAGPLGAEGAPHPSPLPILGASALARQPGSLAPHSANRDFAPAVPSPASTTAPDSAAVRDNTEGEHLLPAPEPLAVQGRRLFDRETFAGNGRTCASCHLQSDQFGLSATSVAALADDDPLFVHRANVNRLVVTPPAGTPAGARGSQPSDFQIGAELSGSFGARAVVLAGTRDEYLVIGGAGLDIPGNLLSDGHGNTAHLAQFIPGNLNGPSPNGDLHGLEDDARLRGPRALIVENINGFAHPSVARASPGLINIKHTAPYGLSGEFADLAAFSAQAVRQHFTRDLARRAGTDFREPSAPELAALSAFMEGIEVPADADFDAGNLFDRFVTTEAQARGRDLFFGAAKCNVCHSGDVLATSNGQFGTTQGVNESFDTGVANLAVNADDDLPTEQDLGRPANTRAFSTPTLFGVRDGAPFFHDNSVLTLREAIAFYDAPEFTISPAGRQVGSIPAAADPGQVADIVAFLRALTDLPFTRPGPIEFGPVTVNEPGPERPVVVASPTHHPATVVSVTLRGAHPGDFALGPVVPLGPSGAGTVAQSFPVRFTPTELGPRAAIAELVIESGTERFDIGVSLTGAGSLRDTDGDGTADVLDDDDDNDGASDADEARDGTSRTVPDVRLRLGPGTHLIALPIAPVPTLSASELLARLGARRITGLDGDGRTESLTRVGGSFDGPDFPLVALSGYEVHLDAPSADLVLTGDAIAAPPALSPGQYWLGFARHDTNRTAFELLAAHPALRAVAELDRGTARYRTASVDSSGRLVGQDFALVRGRGYVVTVADPSP